MTDPVGLAEIAGYRPTCRLCGKPVHHDGDICEGCTWPKAPVGLASPGAITEDPFAAFPTSRCVHCCWEIYLEHGKWYHEGFAGFARCDLASANRRPIEYETDALAWLAHVTND